MYFYTVAAAFLGISSVAAVKNPHHRVPKRPVLEAREPRPIGKALYKRADFLNAKTKSALLRSRCIELV